jgi:hypothetical protein
MTANPKNMRVQSRLEKTARENALTVGYEAQAKIVREKIARLKALRLAKEASEKTRTLKFSVSTMPPLNVRTCRASGNMSGKRRVFKSTAGSIFFASAWAAALSSQPDRLVRNCTKIGTDALYMDIVMERSLRVVCGRPIGYIGPATSANERR